MTHIHSVGSLWASDRPAYLTTHNTHNGQTSMLPAGFESAIPTRERPQTHALERSATGIDLVANIMTYKYIKVFIITLLRLKDASFTSLDPWTLGELFHRFLTTPSVAERKYRPSVTTQFCQIFLATCFGFYGNPSSDKRYDLNTAHRMILF